MSHATKFHVQLVLGNYTNLQFHVCHATKFLLQMIVTKPKNCTNERPCCLDMLLSKPNLVPNFEARLFLLMFMNIFLISLLCFF